jgi:hypothetical protein
LGEDPADDGERRRAGGGPFDGAEDAEGDERGGAPRHGRCRRRDHHPDHAPQEQAPVAEAVTQLAHQGPDHAEGEHGPGDHPGHGGLGGAELVGDPVDRHRQDRDGDVHREQAEQHRGQDPPPPGVDRGVDAGRHGFSHSPEDT